jgi:hypothetical protein
MHFILAKRPRKILVETRLVPFIANLAARSLSANAVILSVSATLYKTSCRVRLQFFLTVYLGGNTHIT